MNSEYQFRRSVSNRSVEEDVIRINTEDIFPEFELGLFRRSYGNSNGEHIIVWLGAANTGFTLVCDPTENRLLAESVLCRLVRSLQHNLRIMNQPTEGSLKSDKVALILNIFLPAGNLNFMNHRVVRQLEKEIDMQVK